MEDEGRKQFLHLKEQSIKSVVLIKVRSCKMIAHRYFYKPNKTISAYNESGKHYFKLLLNTVSTAQECDARADAMKICSPVNKTLLSV